MIRLATLTILASLLLVPAAQAANPATIVAQRLATMHSSQHTYPSDAVVKASCAGYPGNRQWSCKVRVFSASLPNGGTAGANEIWRYVCTGRVAGQRVIGFKAYAAGGIA